MTPGRSVCTVSGTVAHLERIALPPGAVLSVRLLDSARADAPATVLAATAIAVEHQVPVAFSLTVDPAMVPAHADLALWALLRSEAGTWQSDTRNQVTLVDGAAHVDVVVRRLPSEQSTAETAG